ncbi:2-dehydropantoate 2-reductase [Fictibacillus sp. NRS-1165]|uniref:2-dehydropantoate 2-reductase n=1 Tax=Fictibacillus sp. NRS-1165 TaxID=3144463 RepID=UPI003D214B51
MKIAIVGGGSIGLLLAAFFSEEGQDVTVCTRTAEQADAINAHGIKYQAAPDYSKIHRVSAARVDAYREVPHYAIICVKQHRLPEVCSVLQSSPIFRDSTLLFIQNGMGHVDPLRSLPQNNILVGIVEHGAQKENHHEVRHTGKGKIKIASFRGGIDKAFWGRMITGSFKIEGKDRLEFIMKEKLVVNSVINPLTSLFRVQNGDIEQNSFLTELAKLLFKETCSILGINETTDAWEHVLRVCRSTAENRSSMLIDVEEGRQTEIEAISGYLLKLAEGKGKDVPYTRFVYFGIKALERKK